MVLLLNAMNPWYSEGSGAGTQCENTQQTVECPAEVGSE